MMFRYFNLSLFQQVLCYAYSLPLATLGWTGLAFHL